MSCVGRLIVSRQSGRARTSMSRAVSRTVRVIGPATRPWYGGYTGTRPRLGFSVTVDVQLAGSRTDPPMSVPTCNGPKRAAAAAAAPALDPPGFQARFHGLRVSGWKLDVPDVNMP